METTTRHTPTPWKVLNADLQITNGDNLLIANPDKGWAESKANAEFIVEACNSYYQLKEQTSLLKEENEKLRKHLEDVMFDNLWMIYKKNTSEAELRKKVKEEISSLLTQSSKKEEVNK